MKNFFYMRDDGFSFAETIASIAIMLILSAGVGFVAFKFIDQAKLSAAKTQIDSFKIALHSYYIDCGNYPNEAQGLDALWEKPIISPVSPSWAGPYMDKEIPLDPWGNSYIYKTLNDKGLAFVIYSYGADGKEGGEGKNADIVSWK